MHTKIGSYPADDVVFLLKEIGEQIQEVDTNEREARIQSGVHYSEMLPREYEPTERYINLFKEMLDKHACKVASLTSLTAERIRHHFGPKPVIVSLARAGTPAGILIKRYIRFKYGESCPHYSISIIRGKGIDLNALRFILKHNAPGAVVFVDGWTGKGAIMLELRQACESFNAQHTMNLKPTLAVLSDPGYCANISGSFEDYIIPSACLNATVSGLVSRTFHRDDIIGKDDFHGVKYYRGKEGEDYSNEFVDRIEKEFPNLPGVSEADAAFFVREPTLSGMKSIQEIQKRFRIDSIHRIKPGVGETTRVLLRRMPWKILVNTKSQGHIDHILQLAKEREVPLEIYNEMPYVCCGLIEKKEAEK